MKTRSCLLALLFAFAIAAQTVIVPLPGEPLHLPASGGSVPSGSNGDLPMKSGSSFVASPINCVGTACTTPGTFSVGSAVTADPSTGLATSTKIGNVALSGLSGLAKLTAGVPSVATAADIPAVNLPTPAATCTMAGNSTICVCTTTCTVTPLAPVAGSQFCVRNDTGVSTTITVVALSGVFYEKLDGSAYGTVNSTVVSTGALKDGLCLVGRDSTHYHVYYSFGTWTVS